MSFIRSNLFLLCCRVPQEVGRTLQLNINKLLLFVSSTYLINSKRLIIIHNPHSHRLCQIQHLALLNLNHIANRQANLHTAPLIMRPEDDFLDSTRLFLGTSCGIRFEQVAPLVRRDGEAGLFFPFLGIGGGGIDDLGRNRVLQIDPVPGIVQFGGVGVVT